MSLDEIKKEFILFMDAIHNGLLFPKNYFGCMLAILVEQKPITQERIEELTGYSRATISQMIKLIQVNFNLRKIKEPGIRKKFYLFADSPRTFMLHFFEMIIETYTNKVDFLLPLIKEVDAYSQKHYRFQNFSDFLVKFHEMSKRYIELYDETKMNLHSMIKTDQMNYPLSQNKAKLQLPANKEFLQNILNPPLDPDSSINRKDLSNELSITYDQLKTKFYRKFRETLTTGESQLMQARTIIGTEILLENRPITQAEIETATKLARSLISDALSLLLDWQMVRLIKKPGDRKKYYMINKSWDGRLINRLRINKRYAITVKDKTTDLLAKTKQLDQNENNKSLVTFLQHIEHSYEQFELYFEFLEVHYLKKRLDNL